MSGAVRGNVGRFTSMARSLLDSGYGLNDALRLLSRGDVSPGARDIAAALAAEIRRGRGFSQALAALRTPGGGRVFPEEYALRVAGGERSGDLAGAFARLDDGYSERKKARERLVSALVYPAFIVAVSGAGTVAVLARAVPYLLAMGYLDAASRSGIVSGLVAAWAALLVLSAAFSVAAWRLVGRASGESLAFAVLEDYAAAGLPLGDALLLCVRELGPTPLAAALAGIRRAVASGRPLALAFRDAGRFPASVTDLLLMGGESGDAGKMFAGAARHYAERDRRRREYALRASEPAAIAIVGVYLAIALESVVIPLLTGIGGIP